MRYLFLILFLLTTLLSCSSCDSNEPKTTPKGINLRTLPEYGNVKSLANAVRSGVIDSCMNSNKLAFEDMILLTPKMYQMVTHGAYKTKTCAFVNDQLGDIAEWNLVEAFKSQDQLLKIFRYKLNSKKFDFPVELRITFTDLNKLTEYRFFKWDDNYAEKLILMNWN